MKIPEIEKSLFELIKRHQKLHNLFNISNVNILLSGQSGKILLENNIQILTVTKRITSYFDLVLYTKDDEDTNQIKSTDYCNSTVAGLHHSGDVDSLLHYIRIDKSFPTEKNIIVGVIGFKRVPLINFVNQNPMICIVGHNFFNLVPLSLDKATLGNATFSSLFVCKIVEKNGLKYLHYKILPKNITCDGVDTGCCDNETLVNSLLNLLNDQFDITTNGNQINAINNDSINISDIELNNQLNNKPSIKSNEFLYDSQIIQFKQKSLSNTKLFDIDAKNIVIPFGSRIGDDDISENSFKLNLPSLFGTISNHPSVLLSNNYNFNKIPNDQYFDMINQSHVIVHLELQGWDDFISSNTCNYVGNCLFVIHLNEQEFSNLDNESINCLTMVGPRALVIIENCNKYYYYKGINFCLENSNYDIEFGSNVSINLTKWFDTTMINVISEKNSTNVLNYFTNTMMDFTEMCNFIKSINLTQINMEYFENDMINMLIQMTNCYNSEQITQISEMIIKIFSDMLENKLIQLRNKFLLAVTNNEFNELILISHQIKETTNDFNETHKKILEFLNKEMVSTKGCISKNHSLERIKRKLDIKKNVSDVLKMTSEEICEKVISACNEEGVILFNVNGIKIMEHLELINPNPEKKRIH